MTTLINRRNFLFGSAVVAGAGALAACSSNSSSSGTSAAGTTSASNNATELSMDGKGWSYDETNNAYYILGLTYCSRPQATDYETLSLIVPGASVDATDNGDGTYSLKPKQTTAAVVMPVNTPGYAAQKPMTEYSWDTVSEYIEAGLVYAHAGVRGKDSMTDSYVGNAPWGVTDLKAAVRFIRLNAEFIPADTSKVYTFGHSGGGAQSAVMGASGDSDLYTPYLEAIGAAMTGANGEKLSDAIAGAMCWCPITSLDFANLAYEWQMGQFATTGTRADGTWTKAYSNDLAKAFGDYLNGLGLEDGGKRMSLEQSGDGYFLAGSYYDKIVAVVEKSLNDFLSVTTFPYTPSNTTMAGMSVGVGGTGAAAQSGSSSGASPSDAAGAGAAGASGAMPSGMPTGMGQQEEDTTTYNTVEEYFAKLNESETWAIYDSATNTAKVDNLRGFINSQKNATKDVGALDGVSRGQTENTVMGIGASDPLHFSEPSRDVIEKADYSSYSDWSSDYGADGYDSDFAKKDAVGIDVTTRQDMYNPMYYINKTYPGFGESTVAPRWRIRTGIKQGDTATPVELNIALALTQMGISDVDFATIWGLGHTMAELEGDASTNFIKWVQS